MAATVSKYGWATAADWEKQRQTITDLYYYQNKKLREVKAVMEQEYHFFATDKMYKTHFMKWEIKKYNSRLPRGEGGNTQHQRTGKEHEQQRQLRLPVAAEQRQSQATEAS